MRVLPIILFFFICPPVFSQETASAGQIEHVNDLKAHVLPSFPGGEPNLSIWITGNLRIPYIDLRNDTTVTVTVDFTVATNGKVINPKIHTPGFRQLDKAVVELFLRMPRWHPGILNGKFVPLTLTIPLRINLGNSIRKPYDVKAPELKKTPQFKGGNKALSYFIRKNMRYPADAKAAGIGGTVMVEFLVMSNGHVGNAATVGDAIGFGLEEEAIRIVEKMPRWAPAELDGKAVTAKHQVAVKFEAPVNKSTGSATPSSAK